MRYKVGIWDSDFSYSMALMEYLNRCFSEELSVVAFKNKDEIGYFLRSNFLHMLITDRELPEGINVFTLRFVSDRKTIGRNCIFRYQNVKEIGYKLLDYAGQCYSTANQHFFTCVTSPVGRCGKTNMALGICSCFEESLYIGMENTSSISPLSAESNLEENSNGDLFLYYLVTKNPEISSLLQSVPKTLGIRKIILDCGYESLKEVEAEHVEWFRDFMKKNSEYKAIVFDIGDGVLKDTDILYLFDRIFVPMLDDKYSEQKLAVFKQRVRGSDKDDGRKNYVRVPEVTFDSPKMKAFIANLL